MDIYTYYQNQYDNTVALAKTMLNSGYNASVVLTLNSLLNNFKATLNEYSTTKTELDEVATSPQYFGSNRNELTRYISELEVLKGQLETILDGINKLKLDQLQQNSMNSVFDQEDKTKCINNSVNAFPDCMPYDVEIANNLKIINDSDLENCNNRYVTFINLIQNTYDEFKSKQLYGEQIVAFSELYAMLTHMHIILDIINRAISDKEYYNKNVEYITESNPDYYEFEKFYKEHYELVGLISEIYDTNTTNFDKILCKFK